MKVSREPEMPPNMAIEVHGGKAPCTRARLGDPEGPPERKKAKKTKGGGGGSGRKGTERSIASYFAAEHGPSVCGMAFRVRNAHEAYARALELGAQPVEIETGPMELRLPAIKGIGGAPLYLIDRFEEGK